MEEKKTEEEAKEKKYSVGEIVTETKQAVIINGKAKNINEVLVTILNKLDKLEKAL